MINFENVLDPEYNRQLEELFTSTEFPWYFQRQAHLLSDPASVLSVGFTHVFVSSGESNSDMLWVLEPLIDFLKQKYGNVSILRLQSNLLLNHNKEHVGSIHTDGFDAYDIAGKKWFSAVYYVSQSDGDTIFFDENGFEYKRNSPDRNTMILFSGKIPHAASLPVKHASRLVININGVIDGEQIW